MLQYGLPDFDGLSEFLVLLSRKLGKLRKGAKPDTNAAARKVLQVRSLCQKATVVRDP